MPPNDAIKAMKADGSSRAESLGPTVVAAIQFSPAHGDKAANIDAIERLIRRAVDDGAELVVAPEMATTGLVFADRNEVLPLAEPIPGPTTARFAALAQELRCWIVVGMPELERSTSLLYNAAALIGPSGLVGVHRKVHLYPSDTLWASEGDRGFQVWATPVGAIGMMICMDANFPESSRALVQAGASILAMPAAWGPDSCPSPYWRLRAFESRLPLVCANPLASEDRYRMSGGSCVLDRDASILAVVDTTEGIAVARISPRPTGKRDQRRGDGDPLLHSHRYLFDPESLVAALGGRASRIGRDVRVGVCSPGRIAVDSWPEAAAAWVATLEDPLDLLVMPTQPSATMPGAAVATPGRIVSQASSVDDLVRLSRSVGALVVAGTLESCREGPHEVLVLVGASGLLSRRRLGHPRGFGHPADPLEPVATDVGAVGLLNAAELMAPEPPRLLALLGADFLCVPASTLALPNDGADWRLPAVRAAENDTVVAVANAAPLSISSIDGVSGFSFKQRQAISTQAGTSATCGTTLLIPRRGRAGRELIEKPKLSRRVPFAYR